MDPQLQSLPRFRHHETIKHKDKDKGEPVFICTICWRAQYFPSKPKLLGSSARIVCRPCWRAVLDLSICWVCGEYIVRGDEVVSLGWCFWHRACFGCLVCRTKISVPEEEGSAVSRRRRDGMGVELEEIPLCNVCGVKMSGESPGKVLERGVENVSRFDGGLSRERLERWSEVSNEGTEEKLEDKQQAASSKEARRSLAHWQSLTQIKRGCSRCSHQQRPTSSTRSLHSMLHSAIDTRISADGSVDDHRMEDHKLDSLRSTQSLAEEGEPSVYVSIFDPVGEPAFEPSKTKPLPKWMHLLPNNIHREREQRGSREVESEASLNSDHAESQNHGSFSTSSAHLENQTHDSPTLSGSSTSTTPEAQADLPTPPLDVPIVRSRAPADSKIAFIPNPEVESINGGGQGQRASRRSHTAESGYVTAPENPRPKTPFPRVSRPSLPRHETSSYFSHRASVSRVQAALDVDEDTCCGLGLGVPTPTPEETPRQLPIPPPCDRPSLLATPTQSSEYIEKYRPQGAATQYERYVPKEPEPILSKLKRQRVGNQHLEEVAEGRETKRHGGERPRSPKLENEEYSIDPRRRDLNRELRSLFCEV
ncbi:uncharacterized protein PAC_04312 [Phialocephala subalpina]|uniref:LIM zinc-binding domain-containing protein n=1 Tax=Phialocephala subalpina TaxID=576137 RepID=A0A1L7WNT1_9HELO|nr:uncharacterized protein PAC_04312 [Phialocephala subalpina]